MSTSMSTSMTHLDGGHPHHEVSDTFEGVAHYEVSEVAHYEVSDTFEGRRRSSAGPLACSSATCRAFS
jgi:hypothetical protein